MTRGSDYTAHEWELLTTTTELIGFRMLSVSRSGPIGKLRELAALSRCLSPRAIPNQFRRNELVLALLEDIGAHEAGSVLRLSWNDLSGLAMGLATARRHTLRYCEDVAVLLADKTPWAEAEGLKRWLVWLARNIARASGDRWLGLGRRVSDEEAAMLRQIATALHLSPIVAISPTPALDTRDVIRDTGAGGDR